MKEILLSNALSPFEKETELLQFFNVYKPPSPPLLLGQFSLTYDAYQNLSEYFISNGVKESYYLHPILFAFLITEFAYWTDDWESRDSFWESFQKKFSIPFSINIYHTIRRGYKLLNVIPQPKTGFRYVNWCTMQSILGRNAVRRLAELIQYWQRNNIQPEQIKENFEKSYIVDLKLAVLSHLYQIEPNVVLTFLSNLVKREYQNCIYFRNDEAFINQFEGLLKQRLFYYGIFSSDAHYSKEPIFYLEDNRIKCQFFEDAAIRPKTLDIKRYKGQSIIANYRNNRRFTRWDKNTLVWAESFNTFIQSKNQSIEFYLEDTDEKIFEIPLSTLKDKDFWIFNNEGDLLNDKEDEINISLEDNLVLQFVTTRINDLENLNIIDYARYTDEEQYFILKFRPNSNLLKETIGNNVLIYELPESVHFSCTPLFANFRDNFPALNELPEICFSKKILKDDVILGINGEIISQEKIFEYATDEDAHWALNIENLYNWKCFGKNKLEILHGKSDKEIPFEFYYVKNLNAVKIYRFKDHHDVKIEFSKKNQYAVETTEMIIKGDPVFTLKSAKPAAKMNFTIKRLRTGDQIAFELQAITPDASIVYNEKQTLNSKKITLLDLINFPIILLLNGQPQQNFKLQLVSVDNRVLYNFGNDFRFSDTGTFRLGRLFWQKYLSEIKKGLHNENCFLTFAYGYSVPFSKPFAFDICQIVNQKPLIRECSFSLQEQHLTLQLEMEKLPLNSLDLFLFSSDFSKHEKFRVEDEKRLPSEKLKIQKTFAIPNFANDGIAYVCLAVNDMILDHLKQLKLDGSKELNPLASFINDLYNEFIMRNENEIDKSELSEKQRKDLAAIFLDESLLSSFISFIHKPEIIDIFRNALLHMTTTDKLFLWKLLLPTNFENQIEIIRFIINSNGLDFFRLSEEDKDHLRRELATFTWKNTGLIEKLIRVHLYGYNGLNSDEAIDWLQIKLDKSIVIKGLNTAEFTFHKIWVSDFKVFCSGEYILKSRKTRYQSRKNYDGLILENYYNLKDDTGRIRFFIDPDFRNQEYFPPFTTHSKIVKAIREELKDLSDSSVIDQIKSGKIAGASDKLKGWLLTLRRNVEKIENLFFIFYNYWLLSEGDQKEKLKQQIICVFKQNPRLFCYLMIYKELVFQWENLKWEKPDESYFKSLANSAISETIVNEVSVDPVSGQLSLFKKGN